jgi:hypothetical protein
VEEKEAEPFEVEEIQVLMRTALTRRNGVRFVLTSAVGTRKGETLGFRWDRLNTSSKVLRVSKQSQRQNYVHGCARARRPAQLRPQLRPEAGWEVRQLVEPPTFCLFKAAEAEGFEPPDPCGSSAFKLSDAERCARLGFPGVRSTVSRPVV